ncbi:PREDICTED: uncharacterized protein LOC105142983 [Acromyrmex echinatior]|uniref:uncharacterized protein LOC105142983 n=1 Tax=Acromyrmex echinatior TaxID=103372 RepID=UPI000580C2ED|nr:PREDICTED: uncharacterized protein LOC105142983 [Acromyrmex echinatior]
MSFLTSDVTIPTWSRLVRSLNGNYKWNNALSQLVSDYNTLKHRTIDMRPVDVTLAITEKLLAMIYNNVKSADPTKFKIGDSVHVNKYKTVFEKSYTPNWITEVFKIAKVQHTDPVTYLLDDYCGKSISETFYEHELHTADYPDVYLLEKVLRRRGDEVYVK